MTSGKGEDRFGMNLLLRVLVAILFVPLFLWVSYVGGVLFFLYVEVLIFLGMLEFCAIFGCKGIHLPRVMTTVFAMGWGGVFFLFPENAGQWAMFLGFLTPVLFLARWLLSERSDWSFQGVAIAILGVIYIGFFFSHQIVLRAGPPGPDKGELSGWYYLLFPYLIVWTSDTSAYFVGKLVGRHRLAPRISPGKSVEGAVGGFLLSVAAALAYQSFAKEYLSRGDALILGILVAIVCQLGDMIESRIKRETGVKDSSSFIPGHGGVLDRYDGILVAVPIVYYYLLWSPALDFLSIR